ncbi:MAG TPA: CopD family protein [Cyclobacteriaceae bacterium]
MEYLVIKSLHIIFVVTWFAGLFYMVRLLVYDTEVQKKEDPEKSILTKEYKRIQRPLWYGITWPSAILTLVFGFWLVIIQNYWTQSWMLLKFGFILGLYLYHFMCGMAYNSMKKGIYKYTGIQLRIWNEVATIFLVSIVFIVVLKNTFSWIWGLLGILIFSVFLMLIVKLIKKIRENKRKII